MIHRNLYNPTAPSEYVKYTILDGVSEEHIRNWFLTVFVRHVRTLPQCCKLMVPFKARENFNSHKGIFFYADIPEEDWARQAILDGSLYMWTQPNEKPTSGDAIKTRHWIDYMRTELPVGLIGHTVESMDDAIKAWDKRLANQKLIGDLKEGVEQVWQNETHYLVRLITANAFRAEGTYMRHCLWTSRYDRRDYSTCYSLRERATGLPIATVQVLDALAKVQKRKEKSFSLGRPKFTSTEVKTHRLVQSFTVLDGKVPALLQAFINEWFASDHNVYAINDYDPLRRKQHPACTEFVILNDSDDDGVGDDDWVATAFDTDDDGWLGAIADEDDDDDDDESEGLDDGEDYVESDTEETEECVESDDDDDDDDDRNF